MDLNCGHPQNLFQRGGGGDFVVFFKRGKNQNHPRQPKNYNFFWLIPNNFEIKRRAMPPLPPTGAPVIETQSLKSFKFNGCLDLKDNCKKVIFIKIIEFYFKSSLNTLKTLKSEHGENETTVNV